MYNENFEQWFKLNKNLITPFNELNKVATDVCRRMTEESLNIVGENAALFSEQVKKLSTVKKPEDFFNLTRESLNETITTGMTNFQKLMTIGLKGMEEITKASNVMREQTKNMDKGKN